MRNDIAEVAASYVNLKHSGRSMVGLCPFHSEKTPSFHIFPENGSFYCFGCGVGGDVITFVAETFGSLSNYGDGFTATALAQGKLYQIYAVTLEDEPNFEIVGTQYDMFDKIRLAVADKLSANMREDTA